MPMPPEELDAQDGVALAVWFTPEAPGVTPHYSFEQVGGQKAYLHLWLNPHLPPSTTWGWVIPESAVLLWIQDGYVIEKSTGAAIPKWRADAADTV